MTPPAGSRDDDADSAPHREAAPGRADEPDRPRDDERDPQLRAMRAVWLTMRDEDPPDRGLVDLLAAARHQAEARQPRPSAWQRLLAALRRPPVLAFATVTVLIAGAVLIGRRVSREPAPDTRTAIAPASAVPSAAGPATADPAGAAPARSPPPMPPPGAPSPAAAAPPVRPGSDRPPARTATPAASPAPSPSDKSLGADEDRAAAGASSEPPAPAVHQAPSKEAARRGAFSEPSSDDSGGGGNARSAPARPPREEAPGGARHGPGDVANSTTGATAGSAPDSATPPTADAVAAPARRPSPSPPRGGAADDLYQQCEAAAQRSDCATVRRLVRRITRTDPGYRARIPGDSPVARCLTR